jgi:hypothetical protein
MVLCCYVLPSLGLVFFFSFFLFCLLFLSPVSSSPSLAACVLSSGFLLLIMISFLRPALGLVCPFLLDKRLGGLGVWVCLAESTDAAALRERGQGKRGGEDA